MALAVRDDQRVKFVQPTRIGKFLDYPAAELVVVSEIAGRIQAPYGATQVFIDDRHRSIEGVEQDGIRCLRADAFKAQQ